MAKAKRKGCYVQTDIKLRGRFRNALVWVGSCGQIPTKAALLEEAKSRGVRTVVIACAATKEQGFSVAYRRTNGKLVKDAKSMIHLGAGGRRADCEYKCPAKGTVEFGIWARKGESVQEACERGLRDRVDAPQTPLCERIRARPVE